jgi:hypothetical protein
VFLALSLIISGCYKPPQTTAQKDRAEASHLGPRAEAKETSIVDGEVDFAVPADFTFTIQNTGDEPLKLTVVKKSCYCADVRLPEGGIAPAQDGKVVLRWTPIPGMTGPHTISADLLTNDARNQNLRFEVKGNINPLIRIAPDDAGDVDFDRIKPGQPAMREIKVYSTKLAQFGLDVKPADPALIRVSQTKLEPGSAVGDARIASGYSVILRTTDKLPPGSLRSSFAINVAVGKEPTRTITMPIFAEVENGIFRVMPSVVEFRKPLATDEDSQMVRVQFFVPSDKDKIEIVKNELLGPDGKWIPGFLNCEGLQRLPAGQWQFKAVVPADNPVAAQMQADGFWEGRIMLKAADSPVEVPLRVKWVRPEAKP